MIEATFDSYAAAYDKKFNLNAIGRYQRKRVHRLLANLLSPGITLLDVGCGPGSDFGWYGSRGLLVTALDISGEMVRIAKEQSQKTGLDATIHHTAFLEMPEDKQFDVVLLNFGVINAMPDIKSVKHKIKRILKPSGYAIIVSMPPFHLFSALGDTVHLRLSTLNRLFKKSLKLSGGLTIYYYSCSDICPGFNLKRRVHLATVLPAPDQYYQRESFFAPVFSALKRLDKYLAERLPDFAGGDHVCYVLQLNDNHKRP
ncbi:MAG: class I SAM-dependent methyltransferase [Calditrichota bacterium]